MVIGSIVIRVEPIAVATADRVPKLPCCRPSAIAPLGPGGEIHPLDAIPLPAKYTISAGDPNRGATQVASFDAHNVGYLAARNLPTSR